MLRIGGLSCFVNVHGAEGASSQPLSRGCTASVFLRWGLNQATATITTNTISREWKSIASSRTSSRCLASFSQSHRSPVKTSMVTPAFGFSVGDFIAGGQLLIEVINAFKEAGGASSKYASEVSFLNGLKSTLDHLEQFVSSTSQSNQLSPVISKLLNDIRGPWDEFKKFLDKYEPSLGASSSRSKLGKAPRTIRYTAKDISGKVGNLRRQTEQPLQAVNSLLSLHVM